MSWCVKVKLRAGTLALDVAISGDLQPVAIIGPNGAGKTTLLRVIAGGCRPDEGLIRLNGRVLVDGTNVTPPEARNIGYVPQGYGLFPHLNAVDNVAFGVQAPTLAARREAALEQLNVLDAGSLKSRSVGSLSGGEKQKVALARALIRKPELLLLDEPLTALDAKARRSLRGVLAKHLEQAQIPAIIVTHDVRDVRALASQVVVVEAGKVVQEGTEQSLIASPQTDFVAEFFDVPSQP